MLKLREIAALLASVIRADPMFAAAMANAFANAYQEISIRLTAEPSQKAATYSQIS